MSNYQLNYASLKPSMYDKKSREKRAYRMIRTLGSYFGEENLSSMTVLDVGSSTGIIDNILSSKFKKVVGTDIDEGGIAYAKKNFKKENLEFYLDDAMNLSFRDNTFDIVICAQVYEHVPDQSKLFSEIYRVLKSGGVCYLAALNKLRILEPHYNLPFLSWLPKSIANIFLKITRKGDFYYETLLTHWQLQKLNRKFNIVDITRKIITNPNRYGYEDALTAKFLISIFIKILSPFYKFFSPTFFWLLVKPYSKNLSHNWVPSPSFLYRNEIYKKIIQQFSNKKYFLDIGPGNGVLLKSLIDLGYKGDAIDISKEAIAFAKDQLEGKKGVRIFYQDLFSYEPKKPYDFVLCFETLEHIKDDIGAMKKIYKLIISGGYLVMSVPAHKNAWSPIDELKGHFRRYSRDELNQKLNSVGFNIEKIYSYGFPLLWLTRKLSGSGKLLKSQSRKKDIISKTKESSIEQEYNPKISFLVKKSLLWPFFMLNNLFLNTDLGIGYIVIAKKVK